MPRTRRAWPRLLASSSHPFVRASDRARESTRSRLALARVAVSGQRCSRALVRTGRYTVSSSTKLFHTSARDDWPPIFNLVEVEFVGQSASVATGDRFAAAVLAGFDLVPCQVAYVGGKDARLTEVASDATRDAIRSGELRLTGCAFQPADMHGTLHQIGRMHKYVGRGFRLPAGRLAAAPEALP